MRSRKDMLDDQVRRPGWTRCAINALATADLVAVLATLVRLRLPMPDTAPLQPSPASYIWPAAGIGLGAGMLLGLVLWVGIPWLRWKNALRS